MSTSLTYNYEAKVLFLGLLQKIYLKTPSRNEKTGTNKPGGAHATPRVTVMILA